MNSKEVTHSQWRAFSTDTPDLIWKSDQKQLKSTILSDDSPMIGMTWYEATWYCNWLSAQEGIPQDQWCYLANDSGEYSEGMRAKERFWELHGYRLPTEVEWEYACRAGTITSRYYGQNDSLLSNYAWYQSNGRNHAHPVAKLKPNDFGLFDMFGNVYEWCYDPLQEYGVSGESGLADRPKSDLVNDAERHILRGGSFFFPSISLRSAARGSLQPGSRPNLTFGGFRPVRTLPSEPSPPLGP
jgi:formylglycine-generating enzyme required for sulfatase activity